MAGLDGVASGGLLTLEYAATSSNACCMRAGIADDWILSSTSLAVLQHVCEFGGCGNGASSTSGTVSKTNA